MSDASYPDGLYYNEEHDWARIEGDTATFGITWYAQDTLGEVVYFSPSEVGSAISKGGEYGELESTKAVSALIAPLSGEVTDVNEAPTAFTGGGKRWRRRHRVGGSGAYTRTPLRRRARAVDGHAPGQ